MRLTRVTTRPYAVRVITPIELVTFDCDGVLIDSERMAVRLHAAVGAELDRPLTEAEVIDKFIGRSIVSNGDHDLHEPLRRCTSLGPWLR